MGEPSELSCCRGCLSTVNLCGIHDRRLAETFERVTGNPVQPKDGLPQHLCGTCCSLLAKSAAFRERCRRAQHCLLTRGQRELTMDYIKSIDRFAHGLVFSLTLTQVEVLELENTLQSKIKDEPSIEVAYSGSSSFEPENEIIATFPSGVKDEVNHLDTDNTMESSTDVRGCGTDNKVTIIIDTSVEVVKTEIPTVKVEVKKPLKNKERRVRKNTVKKNKQKEAQKIPKIINRRRKTDYRLKQLKDYKPNSDLDDFETTCNVDIKVLNMEQQLAEWKLSNDRMKSPAAFRCGECGKGFAQQDPYKNHMLKHKPEAGPHPCPVCRVRFPQQRLRRDHERKHKLQFLCRTCGFLSRTREQAKAHFNTHTGLKFKCEHCDKSFTKRSTFLGHVRRAHVAQGVACGECGEAFVNRHGLAMHHARMHRAQKAASKCTCPDCGVVFDNEEALATHTSASTGDGCDRTVRPCAVCGESLPTEDDLLRHVEVCHSEQFKCTKCPLTFPRSESLEVHWRRAHPPPQGSRARGGGGGRRKRGGAPAIRGSRVCETCGLHLPCPAQLKMHQRSHTGEKPFPCTECDRAFTLAANLRRHHEGVHLKQRPRAKCEQCGKSFAATWLSNHMRDIHHIQPKRRRVRNTEK